MHEKYISSTGSNLFLTVREREWLSQNSPIRIAYLDNYLAFCDKDEKGQTLTGALKDYLEYISGCMQNATLDFEPVAFASANEEIEA